MQMQISSPKNKMQRIVDILVMAVISSKNEKKTLKIVW